MATDVDICNLALGNLGDSASVSSINPPEGSAQADHCARFFPIARDAILEMHTWGFATKRVQLAQVANLTSEWAYAYAAPNDALNYISVLDPNAIDDNSVPLYLPGITLTSAGAGQGGYSPQPYVVEAAADGTSILYTDQVNAVLRYTSTVTDTSQFSPLFVVALSWLLSSMLAGPVLKGEVGASAAKACLSAFENEWLPKAEASDAGQRKIQTNQNTPWIAGR